MDPDIIRGLGDQVEQAIGSAEGTVHRASADYGAAGLGAEVTRFSDCAYDGVVKLLGEAREVAMRLRLTADAYRAADEESSGASKTVEAQTPVVTQ
ncbi:hypothetical protein ACWKWP_04315 [Agromyces soli]